MPKKQKFKKGKPTKKVDEERKSLTKLPEATLDYYRRVSETWQTEFTEEDCSNEDKQLFLDNVYKQMCEEVKEVSRSQTVSRIVEILLRAGSTENIASFWQSVEQHSLDLCKDLAANHVLETLIDASFEHLSKTETNDSLVHITNIETSVLILSEVILNNLDECIRDIHGVHVVKSLVQILAGSQVQQQLQRQKNQKGSQKDKEFEYLRPAFKDMLFKFIDKIFNNDNVKNIKSYVFNLPGSPFIQTMVLVLHRHLPEKCSECVQFLLDLPDFFTQTITRKLSQDYSITLPTVFSNTNSSPLMEIILEKVAKEEQFDYMFTSYIEEKVLEMALCPVANFVLQKLLLRVNVEQNSTIFGVLKDQIEELLNANHVGVIVKMASACQRLNKHEDKFIKILKKSFHCYEPEENQIHLVPLIASCQTYETYFYNNEEEKKTDPSLEFIALPCSLLLQELLRFSNPSSVVSSLLNLNIKDLKFMACDPKGSRIIDAFLESSTVKKGSRMAFFEKLQGSYVELANDKLGSRVLDTLWKVGSIKQRTMLVEDLCSASKQLQSSFYGKIIYSKFECGTYMRDVKMWKDIHSAQDKKRKLFDDIINDSTTSEKPKKKKRQKSN